MKYICLNEEVWVWTKISLKFVYNGPIDKTSALVQITVGVEQAKGPYFDRWWFNDAWVRHSVAMIW